MNSGRIESWLLALADPQGPRVELPAERIRHSRLHDLFELADRHGVLPAVFVNINRVIENKGTGRFLAASPRANPRRAALESALEKARGRLFRRIAFCLMLRKYSERIEAAFVERDIPAVVLKGPVFADRLYPEPGLRPFADIDLLVPRGALGDAARALERCGLTADAARPEKPAGPYGERTWRIPGEVGGAVELHWNLINCPSQRCAASVEFEDLQLDLARRKDGRLPQPTASSLLLIAAVHGAFSHRFDRLQLLCDVCQAARGVAGTIDVAWLARATGRTGSSTAVAAALALSAQALNEKACGELLRRLGRKTPLRFPRGVLTPRTVMRNSSRLSALRRGLFRELLKRI